ncbi:MAG: putative peptidoglycan glycosyltransferase FtsW [Bryobacteraceae bacterium]
MAQQLKTDRILFYTIIAMVCFGLVIVFSASSATAELKFSSQYYFIVRQLAWAVVSFFALLWFKRTDYRRFHSALWAFVPLGIVVSMLVIAYFSDARRHRWIQVGHFSLQPSEFAKPALIIFLAYFITRRLRAINDRHTLAPAVLAMGVLATGVVIADLGTAVVLLATAGLLFYVAGLDRKYLAFALAGGAVLAIGAVVAKPYRLGRIIAYADPSYAVLDRVNPGGQVKAYIQSSLSTRDPGYQARQSRIAVGAGGTLGAGLMQSKQKLLYLPEAHNDFIFAVVGEELGLWGTTGVLLGFFIILWRGLRLFYVAPDDFGRYLALGVTVSITVQALMNMSIVLDIGPTKGIPLPMISYGGSSLLSTLISLGLLLSVSEHSG